MNYENRIMDQYWMMRMQDPDLVIQGPFSQDADMGISTYRFPTLKLAQLARAEILRQPTYVLALVDYTIHERHSWMRENGFHADPITGMYDYSEEWQSPDLVELSITRARMIEEAWTEAESDIENALAEMRRLRKLRT